MKALKFAKSIKFQLSRPQVEALSLLRGFMPISTSEEVEKKLTTALNAFPELCDAVSEALDDDLRNLEVLIKRRDAEKVVSTIDSRIGTSLMRMYRVCGV